MTLTGKSKVKLEIFMTMDKCVCNAAPFMERIGRITSRFKDAVQVQVKSIQSEEATKRGIKHQCAILDGQIMFSEDFSEKEFEAELLRRLNGQTA